MRPLLLAPALLLAPLAGCGSDSSPAPDVEAVAEAAAAEALAATGDLDGARFGTEPPGALVDVVETTDGGMEMGVTEEVLFTRLSAQVRRDVAEEMERETAEQDGLGGAIARAVTGAVAEGLQTTVSIPLADISTLRYHDGRLVIEMADGGAPPFESAQTNDRPLLASFDAEAGRRLAAAFEKATDR